MQPLSFIEIINRGAIATYPLIVMSILSVAVILERLWSLRDAGGASDQMAESLLDSVKQGRKDLAMALCRQNQQFAAARLFLAALTHGDAANLERATAFMNEAIFAEALVATARGLGVAIIALVFYNYFQIRVANISNACRAQAMKLLYSTIA